jgi:putative sporulation protein YtxC
VKLLSVGLKGTTDEIRSRLQNDCTKLIQEGFRVAIEEINKGQYIFLGCNVVEGELSFRNYERIKNLIKNYVAKILTDQIIEHEEKTLVYKIVEHNYYYFNEEERKSIYRKTLTILNGSSGIITDFGIAARSTMVLTRILEYLDSHHELVLEGFINFRLKEYYKQLVETVDKAVDDFMMELEYKEFIRVLRYFVDVQEPQMEEVHVIIEAHDCFKILDACGKVVNNQYVENVMTQNLDEFNYEDLLITALITIAPCNITMHSTNPGVAQNIIETVKNIFTGRVAVCQGCELCKQQYQENSTPHLK